MDCNSKQNSYPDIRKVDNDMKSPHLTHYHYLDSSRTNLQLGVQVGTVGGQLDSTAGVPSAGRRRILCGGAGVAQRSRVPGITSRVP